MNIPGNTGKVLFWGLSIAVTLYAWGLMAWGGPAAFEGMAHHLPDRATFLVAHILAAALALVLMPFQFWSRLRNRRRNLHRWTGRIYAMAVLVGGISGIALALNTASGPLAASGFGLLGIVWIAATVVAVLAALRRDFPTHRRWMIYSAAMTFAAVTLRIQIPLAMIGGLSFETSYPVIAWSAWVPNVVAVHIWMWFQNRRSSTRATPAPAATHPQPSRA